MIRKKAKEFLLIFKSSCSKEPSLREFWEDDTDAIVVHVEFNKE
jgi:hypothetical protein